MTRPSLPCKRCFPTSPVSLRAGSKNLLNQGVSSQVAFIEELQRRLTPVNGKALPLPTSKSSPSLAHDGVGGLPPAPMDDMRGEHKVALRAAGA